MTTRCDHAPEHWTKWEVTNFRCRLNSDPVYTGVTISCGLCGFEGEVPFNKANLDRAFSHRQAAVTIAKPESNSAAAYAAFGAHLRNQEDVIAGSAHMADDHLQDIRLDGRFNLEGAIDAAISALPRSRIDWKPISTMPFGRRVMLFFERGEKGNGEIDTNWVYPEDESSDQAARASRWSYWTWGGANAGSDFERDEKPVLWADPEPLVGEAIRAAALLAPDQGSC